LPKPQRRLGGESAPLGQRGRVPVALITHATSETAIGEALDLALADGFVTQKPQVICIERG
jgi:homoserine dehydrogenase